MAEISTDGRVIRVSNNIIPKQTAPSSSGIGLQYVRNQYRDIAGEEILIDSTDTRFTVTIPILDEPE